jgi:Glycine zipper
MEGEMKVIAIAALMAVTLSACATREQNGALLGGATGAAVGAIASNSVGGAVVGGAIGAVAGATIAHATSPRRHCWYNSYGNRVCRYY